ncbi:hypothetical protein [Pseudoxanthomonas indica]|uniref:Uncharacterized protein n=1 Tax=Pseudoxanthomonas indica TaxID=428993 RepID=A0A1T5K0E1_9GAMM|nr:hypothetical protein [Pseudoxanthomonas indica]GGD45659.1 hypothetical protein GCM10007235_16980 [Pseudoxanthomonas indica]SKC57010.1 hypothetical protein SAMN06296058_1239 [Pseudoxanthomonas indica]
MAELSTMPKTTTRLTGRELLPSLQGSAAIGVMLAEIGEVPRGAILVRRANYVADTASTSAGDPGAGNLRWNHATHASATHLYIDDSDADAHDLSALWATLVAGGWVYLWKADNLDVFEVWKVSAVTDAAGYLDLTVIWEAGAGAIADDTPLILTIQQPATAGAGVVTGPVSSTDNSLPRFDGTSGNTLQGSGVTVTDSDELAGYKANVNVQTGTTYTLQASDCGKVVEFTNSSAVTVTLPNNLAAHFTCSIVQAGSGQVTLSAASGATLRNRQSHTKTAGQWGWLSTYVRANSGGSAAEYVMSGDSAS